MSAPVVRTPRSSDGTLIYAEAVGNPRNPHVVFIHEATLSASVYDEVFQDPRLTEHLYLVSGRVIVLQVNALIHRSSTDLLGSLRSTVPWEKWNRQGSGRPTFKSLRGRLLRSRCIVRPAQTYRRSMVRLFANSIRLLVADRNSSHMQGFRRYVPVHATSTTPPHAAR